MLFDQICGSIAKPHSLHPRSVRKTLELTRPVSLANDGRRHSNSLDPRTKRPSNRAADGVSIWAGNDKMEHRQKFKYDGAHTHTQPTNTGSAWATPAAACLVALFRPAATPIRRALPTRRPTALNMTAMVHRARYNKYRPFCKNLSHVTAMRAAGFVPLVVPAAFC